MQITLRKANAIQHDIKAAIRVLETPQSVQISEFEDSEAAIAETKARALESRRQFDQLTTALYEIRRKVGEANTAAGIDTALAGVAELDDRMAQLRAMSTRGAERLDPAVLQGKIEKIKATPRDSGARYGMPGEDSVHTGLYTKDEIDSFQAEIATMRRQKRALQDDLLALNVGTSIELSDGSVETLTAAGIV